MTVLHRCMSCSSFIRVALYETSRENGPLYASNSGCGVRKVICSGDDDRDVVVVVTGFLDLAVAITEVACEYLHGS